MTASKAFFGCLTLFGQVVLEAVNGHVTFPRVFITEFDGMALYSRLTSLFIKPHIVPNPSHFVNFGDTGTNLGA